MSAVFVLLFFIGFVLVDRLANRRNRSGPGVSGLKAIPRHGEPRSRRQNAAWIAVLTPVSLLAALSLAAFHVETVRSSAPDLDRLRQPGSSADNAQRQLETELSDPAVVADRRTLKAYQKALVDELVKTTVALGHNPHDATLLKRKELLQVVLTNAGGTGVNDRLSDFEAAMQTVTSRTVSSDADANTVRLAIVNLRSAAASWKTGAFGKLGSFLGLRWEDGRGLTIAPPCIWGQSGWQSDPSVREKRGRPETGLCTEKVQIKR